jgi:hypothetical protein
MELLTNLKQYSFLLMCVGYIFVFFGSIYGLFVDEISLGFGPLTGTTKNILCGFGLLSVFILTTFILLSPLYKALSNARG